MITRICGYLRDRRLSIAGRTDTAGFTLVEVVVALVIFIIVSSAVLAGLLQSFGLSRASREKQVAANLASQLLDTDRALADPSSIANSVTHTTVGTTHFTLVQSTTWQTQAGGDACNSVGGSSLNMYLRVGVEVTWDNMGAYAPVRADTLITPTVSTPDATKGNLAVELLSRDARPEGTLDVHISNGATNESKITASNGCAFFDALDPGVYTVTLSNPNYIDSTGAAVASGTAGVLANKTVSKQFDYDLQTTISADLTTPAGYAAPPAIPISYGNVNMPTPGYVTLPASSFPVDVYPFSDGYGVWAGSCADADPQGVGSSGPFYPGATRVIVDAEPGGSTTAAVALGMADVTVTASGGTPLPGLQLVAVHASDPNCVSGESYNLPGATAADGTLHVLLPYGTWSFQVVGHAWSVQATLAPGSDAAAVAVSVVGA